jgi:hypothetical protein
LHRLVLNRWFAPAAILAAWFLAAPLLRSQTAESGLPDDPSVSLQQSTSSPAAAGQTAPQSSSSSQNSNPSSSSQNPNKTQQQTAEEQLKEQEKNRVLGVMAAFNTTSNREAAPLSTGQKYQLFFKSATDPWAYLLSAAGAGIDQADNSFPEYGQGAQGYAKRFGAAYADYFTGNFFGNAVLTSLFREDPRYFQKGTGSFAGRFLWAASGTVWCKRDSGTWGPNYANVLGNLIGASISNVYYPQSDRTARGTLERGFTVTAQGIIGSEVIEFWPDMVRRHNRKKAEKLAREAARKNGTGSSSPTPPAPPTSPAPGTPPQT